MSSRSLTGVGCALAVSLMSGCSTVLVAADPERHTPFDEGDRVVFFGDSITHGGFYPYYLQLFQFLRHPGSDVRVMNAGETGGGTLSGLRRWPWDVAPMHGNRTFIMLGGNDIGVTLYDGDRSDAKMMAERKCRLEKYAGNLANLAKTVKDSGSRVCLVTPPPLDEYCEKQLVPKRVGCNEIGMTACAQIVRDLAADQGYGLVDFHADLTAVLKNPDQVYLADRVHPKEPGHYLLLGRFLDALKVSKTVAETEVDAAGKGDSFFFTYAPCSMAFPGLKGEREMLVVKNLAAGRWRLSCGPNVVGEYDATDLAAGVNLAGLKTPLTEAANESYRQMMKFRAVDLVRRDVVKMEVLAESLGANRQDIPSCMKVLDDWFARSCTQKGFFSRLIKAYKENARRKDELKKEAEAAFVAFRDSVKVPNCLFTLERISGR